MTYEEALKDLQERPAFAVFLKTIKETREDGFRVLANGTGVTEKDTYHVVGAMEAYTKMFDEGGGDEVIARFKKLTG
jgi:hypothetical protein